MSQENVEIVRRLYEHWARGDFSAPGFFDPDVVYSRIGSDTPGMEGEWRGFEAMAAATREYFHGLLDIRNEAQRIIDRVRRTLLGVRFHLRSKAEIERFFSGLDIVPPYPGSLPIVTHAGLWGAEDPETANDDGSRWFYAAVGRKP